MSEAAKLLGVSHHAIRRLIKDGLLAAEQVVPDAPYQIRASDLRHQRVADAIARKGRPCRKASDQRMAANSGPIPLMAGNIAAGACVATCCEARSASRSASTALICSSSSPTRSSARLI